jgi:uncharacterized membrane protein YfcA
MEFVLPAAFFVTALLYSSAGFGGGSTYSALLSQSGFAAPQIPLLSLPCNILVSGTGFIRLVRTGEVPTRILVSLTAASIPAAFIGGLIPISQRLFLSLLGLLLLYAGLQALISHLRAVPSPHGVAIPAVTSTSTGYRGQGRRAVAATDARAIADTDSQTATGTDVRNAARTANINSSTHHQDELTLAPPYSESQPPWTLILAAGGLIGFASGLTGIGGGILLSPLLWRITNLRPRAIAGLSSGFILLNSLAGLSGQILKSGLPDTEMLMFTAGLLGAVFLGGQLGSRILTKSISVRVLGIGTGSLLLVASVRLMGLF